MAIFTDHAAQVYWTTADNTSVIDGMTVEEVMNGMATIGSSYGFRLETEEEKAIRYWNEIMHINPDDLEMSLEWDEIGRIEGKLSSRTGRLPLFVRVELGEFVHAETRSVSVGSIKSYELAEMVKNEYTQVKQRTRLRAEEAHVSIYKHKLGCAYRVKNPTDFACTCQPITIFGKTRGWFCYMCELPLASEQHGVCAICEPQEYGSHHDVEA